MQRGYIYARYSSASQKSESIEQQIAIIEDYAKRNNIEIVGTYADKAISGKHAENRPELQRMLYDCDRKQVDVVIVYRLDRFARNRYDSATLKARLKKNNIRLLSAMENLSDNPESVILESVLEGMAEYYSLELSQKVRRGMDNNALKGKSNGGQRKFGHRTGADGRPEIVPEEAMIIREAKDQYLQGKTIAAIKRDFNRRGWRWHKGKPFTEINITSMLDNRCNAGAYKFKGQYIDNMIPAIISLEEYNAIQERRELKKMTKRKGDSFVLTGKLVCAQCGASLFGDSGTSRNGEKHYYYTCCNKKKKKTCSMKSVVKADLESAVFELTKNAILKEDIISTIAERCAEIMEKDDSYALEKEITTRDLRDVEKKISNIIRAIEDGLYSASLKDQMAALEQRQVELKNRLHQIESIKPMMTKERIEFWLMKYKNGSVTDPKWQEDIVNMLIREIQVNVHEDGKFDIKVAYNLQATNIDTKQKPLFSGSDNFTMVEHNGIEPLTSCVQSRRSPS